MSVAVFLFLSKLLPVFVLPLGASLFLFLLAGLSTLLHKRKLYLFFLGLGLSYLWLSSLPVTADALCSSIESRYAPVSLQDVEPCDAIIVLGGVLGQALPPRIEPDLGEAADRILTAARLFHAGKAPYIIVAAGNLPWASVVRPEAELIQDLLVEWGVPESAVILDTQSRNSYENVVNTLKILNRRGFSRVLLVTSAMHIPRVMAVFAKVGIDARPVPTDYQCVKTDHRTALDFLPDVDALRQTTMVLRELIGMEVYRLRGWAK